MKPVKIFIVFIIFIVLISIALFIFSLIKSSSNVPAIQTPTPTSIQDQTTNPSLIPTKYLLSPTQTIYDVQKNKQEIISLMPITTELYNIEYFDKTDTFIITVIDNPYEANKELAKDWLKNHGIADLKNINLLITKDRWVE